MKRISMAILFVSVAVLQAKSQASFGIQGGGLAGSVRAEDNGKNFPGKKSVFGFKIGAVASVPISGGVSFMPELNYVSKGGKFSSSTTVDLGILGKVTTDSKQEYTPSFVEVPLNIAYSTGANGFFGGLGPVVSLGIGGKATSDNTVTTVVNGTSNTSTSKTSSTIKFDGKDNAQDERVHLKSVELGGNVFAGYRMSNGFFAKASYNMGFSNLSPVANSSFKTSYFGLSLGYFFSSK